MSLTDSALGKAASFSKQYDPAALYPIARALSREKWGHWEKLPFYGYDLWNDYELSWLGPTGKPEVRIAQILIPASSTHLVESKSLKLYFNSFYQMQFDDESALRDVVIRDLSNSTGETVTVNFYNIEDARFNPEPHQGILIDNLDITVDHYQITPSLLMHANDQESSETLVSHLFRSLCPVTAHPDWATIIIQYEGKTIDRAGLLKYLISYREHQGFHEACVEHIFLDIQNQLAPKKLYVEGCFLRRGGLDINPVRSSYPIKPQFKRGIRQ